MWRRKGRLIARGWPSRSPGGMRGAVSSRSACRQHPDLPAQRHGNSRDDRSAQCTAEQGAVFVGVRSNLVQLNQWFGRHASRTERLRFCKPTAGTCGGDRPFDVGSGVAERYSRSLARYVLKVSRRCAARLHAKRDRRILKQNKYFSTVGPSGGWSGQIALDVKHGRPTSIAPRPAGQERLAGDDCGPAGAAGGRGSAGSEEFARGGWCRRSEVRRVELDGCCQHERSGSVLQWLLRFGRNPLRQEFVTGWKCLHRELPVALPLAILSREGSLAAGVDPAGGVHPRLAGPGHLYEAAPAGDAGCAGAAAEAAGMPVSWPGRLRRMWMCESAHRDLKAANIRLQIPQGRIRLGQDRDGRRGRHRRPGWGLRRPCCAASRDWTPVSRARRSSRGQTASAAAGGAAGIDGGQPRWKDAWRRIRRLSLRDQATIAKTLPWLQPIGSAAGAE